MKFLFVCIALALLPVACMQSADKETVADQGVASDAAMTEEAPQAAGAGTLKTAVPPPVPAAAGKQIIRTARVRIQVKQLQASHAEVKKLVAARGGYLASANETRSNNEHSVALAIRVPAAAFEPLLDQLLKQAVFVAANNVTAEDVTEEYVDIESRLKTKRALEARYLELLKQARSMKDLLELEQALQQVREDIESREGRLTYLRNQVGYSTIHLDMYEQVPYTAAPETGFWSRLAAGAGNGWGIFLDIVVGLATLWPLWLLLAAAAWGRRRWLGRRK